MLRMGLAPSACFNVTNELMVKIARLARRYPGVRLHTHLAETQEEVALSQRIYGCSLGQHLRSAAGMVPLLIVPNVAPHPGTSTHFEARPSTPHVLALYRIQASTVHLQ